MNIDTKIPAVRNVVSTSLAGIFMAVGVIFLLFLTKNFEVDPSPWSFFFTICKWMTEFMFITIYALVAKEAFAEMMRWVDAKNIEPLEVVEPE